MSNRDWFGDGAVVAGVLAGLLLASAVRAQDIAGFKNGYLTFTNTDTNLYYRVEFRPNLTGPEGWDGGYKALRNIKSSEAEVTVPVGVFYRVTGRAEPYVAGTATPEDILEGKTAYVNDDEMEGAMPNIGYTNIVPGTAAKTIPQGYHDGTGEVAGDADLAAGNIKKDVAIFGVTGTFEGGGDTYNAALPKTGQTTSFRPGDDGDLEKGMAPPSPRFTDLVNGTVTDNLTGLMWVKAPLSLSGNSGTMPWNSAIDFCNGLTHSGHSDWRLPNVRELQSLLDYGRIFPALPAGHPFTDVRTDYDWSTSTSAGSILTVAWYVELNVGSVYYDSKTNACYVWPVRAGQ